MRNGNLLFSAIQFLIIAALFFVGAAFFVLHCLPHTRIELSNWILRPDAKFFFLGAITVGGATLLALSFWMMQRGRYLRLQMEGGKYSLDESLVKTLIGEFWKENFPQKPPPHEVYCAHQKIEIIGQEMEEDLEMIEDRLSAHLAKQLGYEREFFLTLSLK